MESVLRGPNPTGPRPIGTGAGIADLHLICENL